MEMRGRLLCAVIIVGVLIGCHATSTRVDRAPTTSAERLSDQGDGADWPGYGRTFGEQHFSPLTQIDARNVQQLGLEWSLDLPTGNSVSATLAVDGTLYFVTGYSIVQATDATTGRERWRYDPKVHEVAGKKLRFAWGSRGLASWDGKLYVGT